MTASEGTRVASAGNEAQAIIDVAIAAAEPKPIGDEGRFFVAVLPENQQHFVIDLESERDHLRERPRRKTGTYYVRDATSLLLYLAKHAAQDDTELWADATRLTVTGVINGHAPTQAGHGDHRVVMTLTHTPAWKAWTEHDRKMLGQVDFAEHVEDRLIDIVTPPAADMLELVQTFTAKRGLAFESGKSLSTGQVQLEYRETLEAKAGHKGRLDIPQRFSLALAPFVGSEPVPMTARLRYRITEGELRLGFYLDRPEDVIRAAFDDVISGIDANTTAPLFHGSTA